MKLILIIFLIIIILIYFNKSIETIDHSFDNYKSFYQKNYDLILQVVELLSSLGIKSNIRRKEIKGNYYYTVSFSTKERVFNLPRKIENINLN